MLDLTSQPRAVQYGIVFVGAGTLSVLIKAASELDQNRLAGLISMVPMKILIAWAIVGAAAGAKGIAESTTGMFFGLGALLITIAAVRLASASLSPGALIGLSLAVWLVCAVAIEWASRRWLDA
ncbi:MAG: hypothetical protein AAFZ65_19605 [Planctomycetota bacterium]